MLLCHYDMTIIRNYSALRGLFLVIGGGGNPWVRRGSLHGKLNPIINPDWLNVNSAKQEL